MGEQVLHRRIGEWARRQPEALAVAGPGGRLTYEALDAQAQRLATELRAAGLAPQQPVLVLADRGLDLVVAQVAISHAGGAFVCVPPDHPAGRLAPIVEAAPPGAVVIDPRAHTRHAETLATLLPGVPVVTVDMGSSPSIASVAAATTTSGPTGVLSASNADDGDAVSGQNGAPSADAPHTIDVAPSPVGQWTDAGAAAASARTTDVVDPVTGPSDVTAATPSGPTSGLAGAQSADLVDPATSPGELTTAAPAGTASGWDGAGLVDGDDAGVGLGELTTAAPAGTASGWDGVGSVDGDDVGVGSGEVAAGVPVGIASGWDGAGSVDGGDVGVGLGEVAAGVQVGARSVDVAEAAEVAAGVPVGAASGGEGAEGEVGLEDLAYVAFTSGSTGRPKGIPHRHATLSQFMEWQGEAFGIGPGSRVAQLAPPGFDVAYCETFGALYRGASLHVPSEATRSDAGQLVVWLREERVTLLQVVPAHWRALLAEMDGEHAALPDLATVLFVGEALAPGLVVETRERLRPAPALVNLYGPTEVVCATFHEVGEVDPTLRTVPVGRPIPGREVFLDDGEICIRSPYLTDGDGGVYRTGDRGRRLPGGELLFVGRADNQVKLRGQRVELEDVEAAVVAGGGVEEAVAAVRDGHDGAQLLVAFVVATDPATFDPDGLRRRLAAAVPSYMVPSTLVVVDRLPRNANGKVDRRAVQQLEIEVPAAVDDRPPGEEPVGEVEEAIAGIWCELLDLPAVGRHADLFTLGGDSLLATRLISRIRTRLGVRVTLGAFFDEPTVAGLAAAAAAASAKPAAAPVPLLRQQSAG